MTQHPKKILIIGATSGIGLALADRYAKQGHIVGVTGRRLELLKKFQQRHLGKGFIKQMDLTHPAKAIIQLEHIIHQMDGVDIIVISAGVSFLNPNLSWSQEEQTIATNVSGFTALASHSLNYFIRQQSGQLVSLSSVAALRGSHLAPAYTASKAYVSNYMQGLRKKVALLKFPIYLTDIQVGRVDTAMAKGDKLFWLTPPDKAAKYIQSAIDKKRKRAYITKRWRLVAWIFKLLPDWVYHRLS